MSIIPTRLLPAIVVPISMLLIATIGFVFYRRKKNRSARNENSDEHFSNGAFDNYETPYEINVYEEYMTNNDRSNNYQRNSPPHSEEIHHHISTQTNSGFECTIEEPVPTDKPEESLPEYIQLPDYDQLKKEGELEKIRQVLAENGDPVRWWLSPGIQVPGKVNKWYI